MHLFEIIVHLIRKEHSVKIILLKESKVVDLDQAGISHYERLNTVEFYNFYLVLTFLLKNFSVSPPVLMVS